MSLLSFSISALGYRRSIQSNQISQRAYVSHEIEVTNAQEFVAAVGRHDRNVPLAYRIAFKNLGNTPAINLDPEFSYQIPAHSSLNLKRNPLVDVDIGPKESTTRSSD